MLSKANVVTYLKNKHRTIRTWWQKQVIKLSWWPALLLFHGNFHTNHLFIVLSGVWERIFDKKNMIHAGIVTLYWRRNTRPAKIMISLPKCRRKIILDIVLLHIHKTRMDLSIFISQLWCFYQKIRCIWRNFHGPTWPFYGLSFFTYDFFKNIHVTQNAVP